MLEDLGFGRDEEQVYRALVARHEATADQLGLPADRAGTALAHLVARGLLTRNGDLYTVVEPGLALTAELLTRRDRLRRTELVVAELAALHQEAARGRVSGGLVQVVEGAEEIARRFTQLQLGARRSIDAFITDGNRVVSHADNSSEPIALARGVRMRAVIDTAFLRLPGGAESAETSAAAGGEIRVVPGVPTKLVITDREAAMIPVGPGDATTLLMRGPLVDLALALFEAVWQGARPYRQADEGLDPVDTRLLHLMLAGLTDDVVAAQLDMSARSVQRRIRALMNRAGVGTRMQLGWHARHHGWA